MSTKRMLGEAEEAPHSKRQPSVLEIILETEEELRPNKRKVDNVDLVDNETEPQKSPKKSMDRSIRMDAQYVEDLTTEDVGSSSHIVTMTAATAAVPVEEPLTPRQPHVLVKSALERWEESTYNLFMHDHPNFVHEFKI